MVQRRRRTPRRRGEQTSTGLIPHKDHLRFDQIQPNTVERTELKCGCPYSEILFAHQFRLDVANIGGQMAQMDGADSHTVWQNVRTHLYGLHADLTSIALGYFHARGYTTQRHWRGAKEYHGRAFRQVHIPQHVYEQKPIWYHPTENPVFQSSGLQVLQSFMAGILENQLQGWIDTFSHAKT